MIRGFLLLLLFIAVITPGCNNKQELLEKADRAVNDSNYNKAILIYNEVLAEDSANTEAYDKKGFCLEELKDYKNAAANYTKSIHFNEKGWNAHMLRAILLCKQERYEYSFPDFQAALDNVPTDSMRGHILTDRAGTYATLRSFDKAMEDANEALKYNPRNIYALSIIGMALSETGKNAEAIPFFEKMIEIDSNFMPGYSDLAFAYTKAGEQEKALEINNKILSQDPSQPYALNNRGYSKMELNDLNGALQDINRSIQLMPGNSYAFRNRGLLYIKLKMNDQACDDFQTALKLDFTKRYGNEVEELVKKHCVKE